MTGAVGRSAPAALSSSSRALSASKARGSRRLSSGAPAPARRVMGSTGNYFAALAGLKLDDSPGSSPRAAALTAAGAALEDAVQPGIDSGSSLVAADTVVAGDTPAAAAAAASGNDASSAQQLPKTTRRKLQDPLVWIDLEMTGLDIEKNTIIEIACLVTDGDLKQVVEGPSIAIHHPESVLDGMNDWCKEHHVKSGLVDRVRASQVTLEQAEQQVLQFVAAHTEPGAAQLAGNSVHVDRIFLQRYMPELLGHLHYRIVDVSTIKECARRWQPKLARHAPRKVAAHTALSDIKESLRELQYYKQALFRGRG